jgi:branched-chain amino acid transport system ATP-binding protein
LSALLETSGLTAFYGASQALFGVDLRVEDGECVALMGRNGMGKTTTIRAVMGLLRRVEGDIRFAGKGIAGCRRTASRGLESAWCRKAGAVSRR